ncbi:MAG TPA: MGMT family protein [Thermoanaerobaculia bacterium]|nr:MGMT family protein [Thermoanaerobaculia bacterium]
MRCESALLRIDELRTGELQPGEAESVRRHLEVCPHCAGEDRLLREVASAAPGLLGELSGSCAEDLARRLFDRWARVRAEGLDLWVAFSERGLTEIVPAQAKSFETFAWEHAQRTGKELREDDLPAPLSEQVERAAAGQGVATPAVDLSWLPSFERQVLQTLTAIPGGEVRSYAWVAREAGRPAAVRAVGNACARNPVPLVVPCHRVVPAAGGIGGYAFGSAMKREILEREGVDLGLVDELERLRAKYIAVDDHWYCFPTCRSLRGVGRDEMEPVRDEREAAARGLQPCGECRPLEAAS